MTKIIAFSGPWNTWKSTAIKNVLAALAAEWIRVKLYPESARVVMEKIWFDGKNIDFVQFQQMIHDAEKDRLNEVIADRDSGKYDLIITDRTAIDHMIYYMVCALDGKMTWDYKQESFTESKLLYDKVLLLTEPIKQNATQAFQLYNDSIVPRLFDTVITSYYMDRVVRLRNNRIDENAIVNIVVDYVMWV